jgi:hypothetical protein
VLAPAGNGSQTDPLRRAPEQGSDAFLQRDYRLTQPVLPGHLLRAIFYGPYCPSRLSQ